MASCLHYIWLGLASLLASTAQSQSFPFPVFRRNPAIPRPYQSADTGYVKRSYDPSLFALPSRGLRSPWSYVTPFGAQAVRSPQIRDSPVYGVPTNNMWTNTLLQFEESAGRAGGSRPGEYAGEFPPRAQPVADYVDDEDYDDSVEDNSDGFIDMGSEPAPAFDWGFIPALEDASGPRYVADERREQFKNLLLPYLLYSALEQDGSRRRPESNRVALMEDNRGVHPQETGNSAGTVSTPEQKRASNTLKASDSAPATITALPENMTQIETTTTQTPEPSTTEDATSTPVKRSDEDFKSFAFDRGQKEFAMLRPAVSANRDAASLKELNWPVALETDDKDEQKRQLGQLPMEIESTRHQNIDSRRWPAVLDDVDDWLSTQLAELKSRDH